MRNISSVEPVIGYALCGSFCTLRESVAALKQIADSYHSIFPIMSETAYSTDTRFGKAEDFISEIMEITGNSIIHTVNDAEPIGPKAPLDLLVIAPATGNTVSKLAFGITDTSVTMAAKAQLRNGRPVLVALCSNDALSGSAAALGLLLSRKNVYFTPMYQDDPANKPTSLMSDFSRLGVCIDNALKGAQTQPLFCLRADPA